ncbi:hypothetical protein [Mesorhizobium xinjiangense]|uniref:hypothetical protein n=1 Tax=Mesorhizobium xinjiangense TaxID=2678685 RepID=UPI001F3AD733|nr:hypothetical protein [Mesorhizobium xinjiangense]
MGMTRKEEARALSADEQKLVEKSHHPAVQELSDEELSKLVRLMRERRDKAHSQAHRRRREMRGKAKPKGASASTADAGSKVKAEVLASVMRRLNNEAERRRRMAASISLAESAQKALALKQAGAKEKGALNTRHARVGMRETQRALEHVPLKRIV